MSTTAGERRGGERAERAFDRRLVPPMVLGSVLNPVNSSLIAVALVPIGLALGAPAAQTAWLVSGLYLATAVGQPVTGRLVDLWGPRPLYLTGAVLMIVGGVLGALAPSIGVLVAARVLIGLGSCAGYPSAMALVRREARRTGRDSPEGVLTVLAISTQTVAVVGPTLGGLLIGLGGWRTVFWVNVPLALACLVVGFLRLPREQAREGAHEGFVRTVDPAGIGLFTAALVTLLLFLLHPTAGQAYLLGAAVLAAGLLGWWERRAAHPFLDLPALAGRPALLLTYVRALLTALVSYCLLYGFTQWLEQGRGLSASAAGLVLVPIFLTGLGVSALTGRRREIRGKLVVGAVAQVLVAVVLLLLGPTSPIWLIVVAAAIAGIPQGLNNLALQNAVYRQADPDRTASSAGLMRTAFYLGAIASSTVGGLAFAAHGATTPGLHVLALVMLGAAVLFLLVTVPDRGLGRLAAHPA